MKTKSVSFLSIGVVLLVGSFIITGILYLKLRNISQKMPAIQEQEKQNEQSEFINQNEPVQPVVSAVTTGTDQFGNFVFTDNIKNYTENFKDSGLQAEWFGEAVSLSKKDTDKLLAKVFPNDSWARSPNIYLYEVGKLKNIDDVTLYYIYLLPKESEMGDITEVWLGFYEPKTNSFIVIVNPKNLETAISMLSSRDTSYRFTNPFSGYIAYEFDELSENRAIISVPDTSSKIVALNSLSYFHFGTGIHGDVTIGDYGDAGINSYYKRQVITDQYKQLPIEFQTQDGLDIRSDDQCYYVIKPNGTVITYNIIPAFMAWETEAQKYYYGDYLEAYIVWNDGSKNSDTYKIAGDYTSQACNRPFLTPCTNTVNKRGWFDSNQLIKTGIGKNGEKIFEMKNAKNNKYYQETFERFRSLISENEITNQSITSFLEDHPIIFWRDHVGNWRVFQKTKYQQQAECS